jgi:hypothetical protein
LNPSSKAGRKPGLVFSCPDHSGFSAAGGNGEGTLVIDLVDAHPTNPPLLKVTVNGRPTKFELARGESEASLTGAWARGREQQIALALEPGSLRQGANVIQLTTIRGSWLVFDHLRLEAPTTWARSARPGARSDNEAAGDAAPRAPS